MTDEERDNGNEDGEQDRDKDTVIEVDFGEAGEDDGDDGESSSPVADSDATGETIDITDELGRAGPEVHAVFPGKTGDPESEVKLEVFTDMVDQGVVMVTLDARRNGVEVPGDHAGDPRLNLNFSHGFQIPDFSYDTDGVRASLLFGGDDIWCDVPWEAVYMMHNQATDEIVQFPSSMPEEILEAVPELKHVLAKLDDLGEFEPNGESSASEESDEEQ